MYRIGQTNIEILHIHRNQLLERLVPFRVTSGEADVTYEIIYGTRLPISSRESVIYENRTLAVAVNDDTVEYTHMAEGIPYAFVKEDSALKYKIFFQNDITRYNVHPYMLPDLLHLEQILIKKEMVVLHSSYIEKDNGAILFTAPSGGGKSTQADLWRTYKEARIINGDKSIIGRENGKWCAYGIPFSGSSEYCLNESYPLKAIVVLEKGKKNTLFRTNIKEFPRVFSQITLNVWDKAFCEKAMDLAVDICSQVPIYHFVCNCEQEAVEILYEELKGNGYGIIE